jgi:hypothetical protein
MDSSFQSQGCKRVAILMKVFKKCSFKAPGDQVHWCNFLLPSWSPGALHGDILRHPVESTSVTIEFSITNIVPWCQTTARTKPRICHAVRQEKKSKFLFYFSWWHNEVKYNYCKSVLNKNNFFNGMNFLKAQISKVLKHAMFSCRHNWEKVVLSQVC